MRTRCASAISATVPTARISASATSILRSARYSRRTNEDVFRVSVNGPVGRRFFNESRFQVRAGDTDSDSLTSGPAILVLDAFNGGGAQIGGGRHATEVEFASDMDFATGRHSARAGVLVEAGRYRSDDVRNMAGTFTFSSLDAFQAGRPTTFTQRDGDPLVEYLTRAGRVVRAG